MGRSSAFLVIRHRVICHLNYKACRIILQKAVLTDGAMTNWCNDVLEPNDTKKADATNAAA